MGDGCIRREEAFQLNIAMYPAYLAEKKGKRLKERLLRNLDTETNMHAEYAARIKNMLVLL